MKLLAPFLFAATAAAVFAAVEVAPCPEEPDAAPVEAPPTGVMPSDRFFGPLTLEEADYDQAAVPEPVWASVLAACAVSLLRRGRH